MHLPLGKIRHADLEGFFGMPSAVPLATKADLRYFRFGCASTQIRPSPLKMTSTTDSDISDIVICLAIRMGKAIPTGIRASLIGSSHSCFTASKSTLWAYYSSFITEIISICFWLYWYDSSLHRENIPVEVWRYEQIFHCNPVCHAKPYSFNMVTNLYMWGDHAIHLQRFSGSWFKSWSSFFRLNSFTPFREL